MLHFEAKLISIQNVMFIYKGQQPTVHQTFQYFGKQRQHRYRSIVGKFIGFPRFKNRITRAIFNSEGKTPLSKDMFIICVNGTTKLECVAFTTRAEIASQPALPSFSDFMIEHTSSSTTGVITILSKNRLSMYVVDDLLSCGMLLTKLGQCLQNTDWNHLQFSFCRL